MFDSKKLNLPAADQPAQLLQAFSRLRRVSVLAVLFHLHSRTNFPDDYFYCRIKKERKKGTVFSRTYFRMYFLFEIFLGVLMTDQVYLCKSGSRNREPSKFYSKLSKASSSKI